jgi:hypothetical protein
MMVALAALALTLAVVGIVHAAPKPRPAVVNVRPPAVTTSTTARFEYRPHRIVRGAVAFQCSLDGRRYRPCGRRLRSSMRVTGLRRGAHRFCVRVVHRGARSRPTCHRWQIVSVGIAASAGGVLMPGGRPLPVDLRFTNPTSRSMRVRSAAVSVAGTSSPACAGTNFQVPRSLSVTVTVPARTTASLADLTVGHEHWPRVVMVETGRNQDACKLQAVELAVLATVEAG